MFKFIAGGLLLVTTTSAAHAQKPPATSLFDAKDLFQLQFASDPQMRPDGRAIAYVRAAGDIMMDRINRSIWLIDLPSGKQQPVSEAPGQLSGPRWSPDGTRLAYIFAPEGEKPQLKVRWFASGQRLPDRTAPSGVPFLGYGWTASVGARARAAVCRPT